MSELWLNKYCPIKSCDIIGNKLSSNYINNWISDFDNQTFNSLIISGPHGIGKSLLVKLLFDENGYDPITLYPFDIKDHKFMENILEMKNNNVSILKYMNVEQKKNAIVIDEAETITLTSEKNYIIDLLKDNSKFKLLPIIFICNNQHSKLMEDIKKNCLEVRMTIPKIEELELLITQLIKKEKMKISQNCIKKIANFSQFDVRRLFLILQEIHYTYKNQHITLDKINTYINTSRKKDIDIGLFEASKMLLEDDLSIKTILQMYETEKVLLPLMIHENYYKQICRGKTKIKDIIDKNSTISDSISIGDNIETSIYTDQNWYLQNMHGFFTCISTSYYLPKTKIDFDIKFSSDLNKTSLKNINKKNISNINFIIPNKNVEEILTINHITNKFLLKQDYKKVIEILSSYKKDLTLKDIELCSKIDKTAPKTNFIKDKKIIQKLLKEWNQL
jgi:DNA polymerase III delta prime subunit